MAYIIDLAADFVRRTMVGGQFPGWEDRVTTREARGEVNGVFRSGSRLLSDVEWPETVSIAKSDARLDELPVYFKTHLALHVIHKDLHAILVALEGEDRHQSHPITLCQATARGEDQARTDYLAINVHQTLDTIIREQSAIYHLRVDVPPGPRRAVPYIEERERALAAIRRERKAKNQLGPKHVYQAVHKGQVFSLVPPNVALREKRITVNTSKISGAHLWRETVAPAKFLMCSDAFFDAMTAAGMTLPFKSFRAQEV